MNSADSSVKPKFGAFGTYDTDELAQLVLMQQQGNSILNNRNKHELNQQISQMLSAMHKHEAVGVSKAHLEGRTRTGQAERAALTSLSPSLGGRPPADVDTMDCAMNTTTTEPQAPGVGPHNRRLGGMYRRYSKYKEKKPANSLSVSEQMHGGPPESNSASQR